MVLLHREVAFIRQAGRLFSWMVIYTQVVDQARSGLMRDLDFNQGKD